MYILFKIIYTLYISKKCLIYKLNVSIFNVLPHIYIHTYCTFINLFIKRKSPTVHKRLYFAKFVNVTRFFIDVLYTYKTIMHKLHLLLQSNANQHAL